MSTLPVFPCARSYFWSQWSGQWWTAHTVRELKEDWGCTIVRAAMGVEEGRRAYLSNRETERVKVS